MISLLAFLALCSLTQFGHCLWPSPKTYSSGDQTLLLSPDFRIDTEMTDTPTDLTQAISRTKNNLLNDKLGRLVIGRGSSDSQSFKSARSLTTLKLMLENNTAIRSIADEAISSLETRSEGYKLLVPADGSSASISATSTLGLFRGLTTFEQLWYEYENQVYAIGLPLEVEDSPSYVIF